MRPIKTIVYASHFARAARKLPQEFKEEIDKRERIFREDCFDPRLETHKLKGKYHNLWSFSITHKHRVMFKFLSADMVYFLDVGDHSIYR